MRLRPLPVLLLLSLAALPAAGADRRSPAASGPSTTVVPASVPASGPNRDSGSAPGLTGTAPDFQYLAHDGRWKRLHELLRRGSVLLVFEPGDVQLLELQREADSLASLGVIPVAVRNCSEAKNWATIGRLKLTMSLLSDPRGELAAEFHVPPARGAEPGTSWFLVDPKGRVRALDRGRLPEAGFSGVVSGAMQAREQGGGVTP